MRHSNAEPIDSSNNVNRLSEIVYPQRTGTHDDGAFTIPRTLLLGYGATNSVSDLINRVESLSSSGGPDAAVLGHIASYRYDGISRLEGIDLGNVPGQASATFVQSDDRSFDLFGRVIDRTVEAFDVGTSLYTQVMHSEFGYDLRGQRIYERMTQLDHPTLGSRDNIHSSFFDYDALGRMIGEEYGALGIDGFQGIDHTDITTDPFSMVYGLDSLNRRVGINSAPGVQIWADADHDAIIDAGELSTQTHVIDERGGLIGLDDGSSTEVVGQDISGAITSLHGRNVYHDWLGRPVLVMNSSNTDAIFSVNYDGFGRVAQRKAPWPNSNPNKVIQRIETYFYDGVRRIQEVFTDPIAATPPWPVTIPIGGLGGYTGDTLRTEAEYIWSAAGGQPFDTCHVQIDWWDREAWFIQDHVTGTVRAYTDANGELVRQYRFDAFGNLSSMDTFPLANSSGLFNSFRNRLGHQGLFAERVDNDTTSTTLSMNPNAEIWYQSRSRWYVPELGRFMTSDPNSTGIPTMSSLAMLGKMPVGPPGGSFEWNNHYGDGWDTYTAYGANPMMNQDPSGLFFGLAGLLGGSGASQVGNFYNNTVAESGQNAMGALNDIASGMGVQQAMMLMLIDSITGNLGPQAFDIALAGFSQVSRAARNGFGRGVGNAVSSLRGSKIWTAASPGFSSLALGGAFAGDTFTERVLTKDTKVYRFYGGKSGPTSSWWTTDRPSSSRTYSQTRSGLNPDWGNTMEYVGETVLPAGTRVYDGLVGPQQSVQRAPFKYLSGGGQQFYTVGRAFTASKSYRYRGR